MRILFLSNFYPPHHIGGLEQRCQEVATRLKQRGHHAAILTSDHHETDKVQEEEYIYRVLKLESDLLHYVPLDFFISRRKREKQNLHHLDEVMEDFRPDVVFVWGMWNLSRALPAYMEAHSQVPVVYSIGDPWPAEPDMHTAYWQSPARHRILRLPKRLLASLVNATLMKEGKPCLRFDRAICVSAAVRENLIRAGLPVERAFVIHGGIEVRDFPLSRSPRFWSRQDGTLRVLYAGGLGEHKGVHTAIEALGILQSRAQGFQISLTLVGEGHPSYKAFLRDLISKCGVSDFVSFRERVPREQMGQLYREYDVLVFPSVVQEGLGRVILEAMASGLVVIGTAVGGAGEIMRDNENALTFAPGDAKGLADEILRLISDPMLCQRLVDAGRRTILERFTLERMVGEIENYLNALQGSI
jgi:glycosyltransferase involved in cell wall biosynthesis